MSAGAGTGLRGTGIREFGKSKIMGIRVPGDSAYINILTIYFIHVFEELYLYLNQIIE